MKKLSPIIFNAGKSNTLLTLAFAVGFLFAGCNKERTSSNSSINNSSINAISNADMTQAVTNAVSGSANGIVTQSENTAMLVATAILGCGQSSDTTISGTSQAGALITYSYNLVYNRTSVCTGGVVSCYNTTITGGSSYSFMLMSSADSTSAQISVSGVQSSSSSYLLNETYVRKGTQQSFITNQHAFASTLTFTSNNIIIDKTTKKITSGTATVKFNGTDLTGKAVSSTATVTFLGNNQATLVLNNGNPTTINW